MIRFAKTEDIPAIMCFIHEYWRKNHIMSRDKKLFEFQHKWGDEVSFVISETDGNITGILGYIPYGESNRDITLAIWKTIKTEDVMQGIKIFLFLCKNGDVHTVSAPGINPNLIYTYKYLGFYTGKMVQWYRLRKMSQYSIAVVKNADIPTVASCNNATIYQIHSFQQAKEEFDIEQCLIRKRQLYKSLDYLKRRYFDHPTYKYIKYGIEYEDKKLLLVLRIQTCNNSAILRVIDCIGDHVIFPYFTTELDRLLAEKECEYADCYETGLDEMIFQQSGWRRVDDSGNIMPEYYSPFEQRNIDIYYMSQVDNVILFKGDGDMDRPN